MKPSRIWILVPLFLTLTVGTSPAQVPPRPLRIVTLGDSTTARWSRVHLVYPDRLAGELARRGVKVEVFNAGVSGDTAVRAARRFEQDVLDMEPDVCVIQLGINDSRMQRADGKVRPRCPLEDYERILEGFVTRLIEAKTAVLLMTPNALVWTASRKKRDASMYQRPGEWSFDAPMETYCAALRRLAKKHAVPLLDVHALYRAKGHAWTDAMLLDGVHPGDVGHDWLARQLADKIVEEELHKRVPRAKHLPVQAIASTLPFFDLSGEAGRQVIVDREKGQYLGHVTTALMPDGKTLLCTYPKGHGKGAIVMKRSTDGGLTWSSRLPLPKSFATSKEVPTLFQTVDAKGQRRWLLFSGLYPIRMAHSEDEGETWSELEPIGDFGGIVAMGSMVGLASPGHYLTFFHDDGRFIQSKPLRESPSQMRVYQCRSTDGGLTWSRPVVIAHHSGIHLCEPGAVLSPDRKEIAILLRENTRRRNSHVIFSRDGGKTWSTPRELPASLTGDRHTARYLPDGRLFVTFRDTGLQSPTVGDWVAWVGRYEDIRHQRQGEYRIRLMDNFHRWDCAYPGLELLPEGTIVTTTYGHWSSGEPPYIVSVRLRIDEIDARWKARQAAGR